MRNSRLNIAEILRNCYKNTLKSRKCLLESMKKDDFITWRNMRREKIYIYVYRKELTSSLVSKMKSGKFQNYRVSESFVLNS